MLVSLFFLGGVAIALGVFLGIRARRTGKHEFIVAVVKGTVLDFGKARWGLHLAKSDATAKSKPANALQLGWQNDFFYRFVVFKCGIGNVRDGTVTDFFGNGDNLFFAHVGGDGDFAILCGVLKIGWRCRLGNSQGIFQFFNARFILYPGGCVCIFDGENLFLQLNNKILIILCACLGGIDGNLVVGVGCRNCGYLDNVRWNV